MSILDEHPDATHIPVIFNPQLWVGDRAVTGDDTMTYLGPLE